MTESTTPTGRIPSQPEWQWRVSSTRTRLSGPDCRVQQLPRQPDFAALERRILAHTGLCEFVDGPLRFD